MISEIGKGDCLVRVFGVADEINILVGVVVISFCVIADVDTPSVAGGVCVVLLEGMLEILLWSSARWLNEGGLIELW